MSEKIYAYLLRLFPSAFRSYYEEEALRFLRDRLRDERGFFHRLRLGFDLIMDTIGALPQAYRNSYAGATITASQAAHFDGVPSFRVLQKEPIRPGAIIIAGVLTLTAIATFSCVMEQPIPYRPVERNGPKSPIESVLKRLNQPIPPDSAGNLRSDASEHVGRPPAPNMSATNSLPSPGTRFEPSAAGRPWQPNSGYPDHGSSRAVAVPDGRQSEQTQEGAIGIFTRGAGPSNVQIPAPLVTNLSGKWTGSPRTMGKDVHVPLWFAFNQNSAKLNGTGGPDSTEQYPILDGLVAGDSVMFELQYGRTRFFYDLKMEDRELRGTLSMTSANRIQTTRVWLERAR